MSLHDKHRQRMDKKVCENGLDSLEAHEQLEHLLFAVIPRGDTNKVAHRLLNVYGTLNAVINADPKALEEVEGVGHRTAMFLTSLPSLLGIVERCTEYEKLPELFELGRISKFVVTYFYGRLNEAVYMFSLNSAYKLIAAHRVSEGIAGEVHAFPAKLVKQAIIDNATAVVIVHNHPNGILKPSVSDTALAHRLVAAFDAVDINLRDCVIVNGRATYSMRENGYLELKSNKDDKGK